MTARLRARVRGTVQGVGFRPFVYRLAHEQGLGGYVLNDEQGVLLEVEGADAAVAGFLGRLHDEAPPLAVIDGVCADRLVPTGEAGFRIVASRRADPHAAPPVAADSATCPDCLAELRDPADRRFRYPFVNCTNCGPRLTIVTGVPYDRPLTTMAPFRMCPECAREYADPGDRRFHAEPNACPRCGPRVRIADRNGAPVTRFGDARDTVEWVARAIAGGAIAAVKSIGGFHLVCDATDAAAVSALRARKQREDKPFALLCAGLDAARGLVALTAPDEALLASPARPIVLAPRRPNPSVALAPAVAPGVPELGVMLPYAPLHHLLIGDFAVATGDPARPLVMTSGNRSEEPIAHRDDDALQGLAGIADLFVLHDRAIETRTDDSVARTVTLGGRRAPLVLRRSRGYVPAPLTLPVPARRALLACGAELKSTFCLAGGARAWVGHHIGDLEHYATLVAYRDGIEHFERLFAVAPRLIAHDLHPDYLSTGYALARAAEAGLALEPVQHHHAHLAACLAEHGVTEPAVGAIYDGTGLGTDGTVWGGELLVGDLTGFQRGGALWPVRMPGAAAAIREPWRMAAAWLAQAYGQDRPRPRRLAGADGIDEPRWRAIARVAATPDVSPATTSVGRLLDAVGALCGLGARISYEGQTAIALEAAAWEAGAARARIDPIELVEAGEDAPARLVLDPRAMLRSVAGALERGAEVAPLAAAVHDALSAATAAAVVRIATERGLGHAVLSGGVFQNRWLLETVAGELADCGLRVLVPERLPPNDGGISFGQAAVAAARDARRQAN